MRCLVPALLIACGSAPSPEPAAPAPVPSPASSTVEVAAPSLSYTTSLGSLTVHPVRHGTLYLSVGERVLWIDPVGELGELPKADAVLVTDIHGDHLDPAALSAVRGAGTVIAPAAVAEKLGEAGTVDVVLANGASTEVLGLKVTAVPMYNHTRGPEPGVLYHDKGRGNGYLLDVDELRIYIAGDTACTEEMKALTDVDHAFVPMNLPYTMPPEEAAECVAAFAPKVVTPYHYRGSDLDVFEAALEGSGVAVLRAEFYPE